MERGIALFMVIISIGVLTVVGAEFAYNSRVDLQLAANHRDETRAYFLARSALSLSRLLLSFQRQVDAIQLPNLGGLLAQLTGGAGPGASAGGGAGAGGAAQPSTMSIQLWRMARIDCYMLQGMVPQVGADGETSLREDPSAGGGAGPGEGRRVFGGFEGCFNAQIFDEEEKINLNKLDAPQLTSAVLLSQTMSTFGDKKYEFVFEAEDANRIKVAPTDVILAMRDWVDEDETQSTLNLTGQGEPFARGFSDEGVFYDRYEPRYRPKNGRLDSLDELYRVHGVNDRFMAAFRDKLTVYPDVNSRLNVNTDDPILLELAIRSVADPGRPDPRLSDPVFIDTIIQRIRAARVFSMFGMSVVDFVNLVEAAGVAVNPSIKNNPQNQRFVGDKSTTFSIKAVGEAGAIRKTLTAVVRTDAGGMGRLVYYREE